MAHRVRRGATVIEAHGRLAERLRSPPGQPRVAGQLAAFGGGRPEAQRRAGHVLDLGLEDHAPSALFGVHLGPAADPAFGGDALAVRVQPLQLLVGTVPAQVPDLAVILEVDVSLAAHVGGPAPEVEPLDDRPGVGDAQMPAVVLGLVVRQLDPRQRGDGVEVRTRRQLARQLGAEHVLVQHPVAVTGDQAVGTRLNFDAGAHGRDPAACRRESSSAA